MAVYWFFCAYLLTEMELRSINSQKKMKPTSSHLNQTSLVNKGFTLLYGFGRNFSCATRQVVSSGQDLALINRAGGLYGRILTEVVSTDRTQ